MSLLLPFLLVPLDSWFIYEEPEPQPIMSGIASRYDYKLWNQRWSKTHNTCALRIYERYKKYKVCSKSTGKCVECYHNDFWPAIQDRIIDLSSHAFKELWVPLSRGLTEVEIYSLDGNLDA